MTHTKFTITSIILCGISNLIEQALSLLIFPNTQIFDLFHGNLSNFPLLIAIFIKMVLSALIGGILGFVLFPFFYPPPQMKVDFSNNKENNLTSSNNENDNQLDRHIPKEILPTKPDQFSDDTVLKPDEAAVHNENIAKKEQFEEKLSSGTFEDPNVVVENPGQSLVENPATLFDPPNVELKKPQLDDESYGKKRYELGTPKP